MVSPLQKIVDAYVELGATVVALMRLNGSSESGDYARVKAEAREGILEIVEFEDTLSKVQDLLFVTC